MGCSSYPPKQNAKRFACLIKCKSALARAPIVLRGIGLRTNRRQPIRLCTHCLASSHSLLIPSRYADARDAGGDCACFGHSKMLRRCRLFKNSPPNALPPALCLRVRGCLHVSLYFCSICAPENAHGRGSRRGLPFYTAPKSCDVQIAVPERSTHVATLLYITTTNIVPWWSRLYRADIASGEVPTGLQSGIIILYQHGGRRL